MQVLLSEEVNMSALLTSIFVYLFHFSQIFLRQWPMVSLIYLSFLNSSGVKTFSLIRTFAENLKPQRECEEQHYYSISSVAADKCIDPWHHAPL